MDARGIGGVEEPCVNGSFIRTVVKGMLAPAFRWCRPATESRMLKISKTRSSNLGQNSIDEDLQDTRPLRIAGATITAWSESLDINLKVFFARPSPDATVAGATSPKRTQARDPPRGDPQGGDPPGSDLRADRPPVDHAKADHSKADRPKSGTVSLSDGTQITFATAAAFGTAELM